MICEFNFPYFTAFPILNVFFLKRNNFQYYSIIIIIIIFTLCIIRSGIVLCLTYKINLIVTNFHFRFVMRIGFQIHGFPNDTIFPLLAINLGSHI